MLKNDKPLLKDHIPKDDYEESLKHLNRRITEDVENPTLYRQLATLREKHGDTAHARDNYKTALFFLEGLHTIPLQFKLKLKIKKLDRILSKQAAEEEQKTDGSRLFQYWNGFKAMNLIFFLYPIWLTSMSQLRIPYIADNSMFFLLYGLIFVPLLLESTSNLTAGNLRSRKDKKFLILLKLLSTPLLYPTAILLTSYCPVKLMDDLSLWKWILIITVPFFYVETVVQYPASRANKSAKAGGLEEEERYLPFLKSNLIEIFHRPAKKKKDSPPAIEKKRNKSAAKRRMHRICLIWGLLKALLTIPIGGCFILALHEFENIYQLVADYPLHIRISTIGLIVVCCLQSAYLIAIFINTVRNGYYIDDLDDATITDDFFSAEKPGEDGYVEELIEELRKEQGSSVSPMLPIISGVSLILGIVFLIGTSSYLTQVPPGRFSVLLAHFKLFYYFVTVIFALDIFLKIKRERILRQ
ncbi:MAG: hypothetical protein GY765_25580 [bacterium]|nr:hypothetical protein [bacterium]